MYAERDLVECDLKKAKLTIAWMRRCLTRLEAAGEAATAEQTDEAQYKVALQELEVERLEITLEQLTEGWKPTADKDDDD